MAKLQPKKQLSTYDEWCLERYGNILPDVNDTPEDEMFESGIEQLERLSEWMDEMANRQLEENHP